MTEYRFRQQPNESGPEWRLRLLGYFEDARAAVEEQVVVAREADAARRTADELSSKAHRTLQAKQKAYNAAAEAVDDAMLRIRST